MAAAPVGLEEGLAVELTQHKLPQGERRCIFSFCILTKRRWLTESSREEARLGGENDLGMMFLKSEVWYSYMNIKCF